MSAVRFASVLACFLLLSACTPAPQDSVPVVETPAQTANPVASDTIPYDTTNTLEDLMTGLVAPSAEQLWNAVSYIASAEGVTETLPDTDEEWIQLRTSALTLIEAGNMLMIPGRAILTGAADPATAGFQYTPDEIAQLLTDDPQAWQSYAQQLQETTRMTLQAIELRDVMGLQEFGAEINDACQDCHAQYWYRPQGVMAPQ